MRCDGANSNKGNGNEANLTIRRVWMHSSGWRDSTQGTDRDAAMYLCEGDPDRASVTLDFPPWGARDHFLNLLLLSLLMRAVSKF